MTYLTIGCLAICFIGVANDGGVKGLNVTDELLKNVAAIRADGKIQPQPSMAVEKVSMDEGDIVNTTVGNASIWSLLISKKIRATYERFKSGFKSVISTTR
jgi:predicted HTH transcriptional regulator